MPTLILCGGDDELSDPERVARLAGGEVSVQVYPGLRHDLFHEVDAARVVQDVVRFVG